MSDTSPVSTTVDGDVAVITLDDGKANALSFAVIDGLNAALDASESSAGAVAIIGRDGKFSAGFDLKVMTSSIDDARRLLRAGAELALRVYMSPIPIVLGITGHALAMGGILATTADYRIGADGPFKLGLNEVAIGMPVPTFGVELCRDRLTHTWFTRCVQHAHLCTPAEAVAAAVGFEVLTVVGTVYVPQLISRSSALYGSIGVVFAILAWLALFARLVVYSSTLNAVLYEAREGTVSVPIHVPRLPGPAPVAATRGGVIVGPDDPAPAVPS